MLRLETIEPKTLDLLKRLQSLPIFAQSRLVGGTALALQLGHRKSIDLDMFGTIEATPEEIQEALIVPIMIHMSTSPATILFL